MTIDEKLERIDALAYSARYWFKRAVESGGETESEQAISKVDELVDFANEVRRDVIARANPDKEDPS